MTRAFASLIVILILAGAALAVNGILGSEPGHRLASRCNFSAEAGQSCQTGRSGYGIDDVALNDAATPAASPEPKARKRSTTAKAPADAPVNEAAAPPVVTAPAPSAAPTTNAAPMGRVAAAAAPAPESAKSKPVEAPAPVREATAWKDPVAPLDPAPAAKPAVVDQTPKTAQVQPVRPEAGRRVVEPKTQGRPEPARAPEPKLEARPEPRVRTAEPKVNSPEPRTVAEATPRTREPLARETDKASVPKVSGARVAEAPKARRRIVTRPVRAREAATEVASVSPPAPKALEVAPARKLDLVTESAVRRVVVAPRRILRQAAAPADDDLRVGASAALVPPRPIPDRSAGSSAFPSDFQAALRHYNARYSMYAVRRAPSWSGDD